MRIQQCLSQPADRRSMTGLLQQVCHETLQLNITLSNELLQNIRLLVLNWGKLFVKRQQKS